jgi:hypothetical protein
MELQIMKKSFIYLCLEAERYFQKNSQSEMSEEDIAQINRLQIKFFRYPFYYDKFSQLCKICAAGPNKNKKGVSSKKN